MLTVLRLLAVALALVLAGCSGGTADNNPGGGGSMNTPGNGDSPLAANRKTMTVTSSSFAEGAAVPDRHSRYHDNITPPLEWSGAPDGTAAFAIIVDDPDAPRGTWLHWTAWNLPADMTALAEGVTADDARFVQGTTDFGSVGYGGPQPPSGTHRYRYHVIALSETLSLDTGASLNDLHAAMAGKVLAWGVLTGTYSK